MVLVEQSRLLMFFFESLCPPPGLSSRGLLNHFKTVPKSFICIIEVIIGPEKDRMKTADSAKRC